MATHSIGLTALLIAQTLCLGTAPSQAADTSKLQEEISKQEAIYQGRGEQLLKGYVIDRTLASYAETLPAEFERSLATLGPQDRWLDIGAGEGKAILDYYAARSDAPQTQAQQPPGGKASCVAISIEDRRTAEWYQTAASLEAQKIQYFSGRRLGEYAPEELGRFQIVTDVIGGFSYTSNLAPFMEKALAILAPGGSFYTVLQDVRSEDGSNKPHYEGSPYLTEIKAADGAEIKVCTWLKKIGCAQVTCQLRTEWVPPIEVYHIRKVCEDIEVPALVPLHYEAGTPPERRFQLKEPSQPSVP